MKKTIHTTIFCLISFIALGQLGTSGSPFTSLHQAAAVVNAGTYHFNLGGTTFDTYVDSNGYVQVAIDYGNGVGNLPQGTSLTTASRGILSPAVLSTLTEIQEIRISSNTGNVDVTTTNATILSRVQNNLTVHRGVADNGINNDWTGTNAGRFTGNATCTSPNGGALHQNIVHVCGDPNSFNWMPSIDIQREHWNSGEVAASTSLQLWVKGDVTLQIGGSGNPFTSLHQAAAVTNAGVYHFNLGGTTFDTYVDSSGYVQVAIDYGDGVGNLPQSSSLTTAARGVLNTTVLASLTEIQEVRLSSNIGGIDVTTTNSTIIARIQSNTVLHNGTVDNAINNDWVGKNAGLLTNDASCNSSLGNSLHQNIAHPCGNTNTLHWMPSNSSQRERHGSGEVASTTSLQLWVKGNAALILPIDLVYFKPIVLEDLSVALNWQTSAEINNDYFVIERSVDAMDWEEVTRVDGAGQASSSVNYTSIDRHPYRGISYYRLKQVDFDGNANYSPIKSISINKLGEAYLTVYPNPAHEQVTITSNEAALTGISIYDGLGNNITSLVTQNSVNESQLILDLSSLSSGLYYIKTEHAIRKIYKQ